MTKVSTRIITWIEYFCRTFYQDANLREITMKSIFKSNLMIIAAVMFCLFLFYSPTIAQDKADRTVEITYDTTFMSPVTPDFLPCYDGDSLTIVNLCIISEIQKSIVVGFNTATPLDTVPYGDTIKYGCTDSLNDCYTVEVTDKNGFVQKSSGCVEPGGVERIPTLSEWGLIIFSLLILSLVTVVVTRRRTATSAAGVSGSVTISGPVFVPARFIKALTVTLGIAAAVLITAIAISGSIPVRDIFGTVISASIVAYIVHLWIVPKEKE